MENLEKMKCKEQKSIASKQASLEILRKEILFVFFMVVGSNITYKSISE